MATRFHELEVEVSDGRSPVEHAISSLHNQIAELQDVFQSLNIKLQGALTPHHNPGPIAPGSYEEKEETRSPIRTEINSACYELANLTDLVRNLIHRVDV